MDVPWQNIFYVIASIALILFIFLVIAIFYLIASIRKRMNETAKVLERLTVTRTVFKILKLFF